MTRQDATQLLRMELNLHGLNDWKIRLNNNPDTRYLGLCDGKNKTIILNAYHIEMHPDPEIQNTIKHEVAHALVGVGHGHDEVWQNKAKEIGCTSIAACSHLSLPPAIIDAIRSGAEIEVTYETEIIHRPKYTVHKLTDKCPTCNKVAVEKKSWTTTNNENDLKFIQLECGHVLIKKLPKSTPFHTLLSANADPNCKHEWNPLRIVECIHCGCNRPYPFQVEGMKFIERGLVMQKGVGVFDEMGLGKTVQSLGYIKFHPEACPVLYVVKGKIKYQWFKAIIHWLGWDHLPQVINTGKDGVIPGLKSYIVSYDMLRRFDTNKIKQLGIKTMVLDECQQIKNPDSSRTAEVRALAKVIPHVIPLSGSPWKNRGSEFFVALNMLEPSKFPSYQQFVNRWVDTYWEGAREKQGGIRDIKAFRDYTKDLLIRREREEVMPELPKMNRVKLYTQMEKEAEQAYDKEVNEFIKWYNNAVIGGEEDSFETAQGMLARMNRMRHLTGLAKIPVTINDIEEHLEETDRKLIVFVHHIDVGELILQQVRELDVVKEENIPVLQIYGGMDDMKTSEVQDKFNNSPRAILIASTLAAGEGLNLQTCSDCIIHERQWNPQNEEQAEGRMIRIGQEAKKVNAKYATAAGTIDEQLDNIIERKRIQFHAAMNKGELARWDENSIIKELAETIVKSHKGRK